MGVPAREGVSAVAARGPGLRAAAAFLAVVLAGFLALIGAPATGQSFRIQTVTVEGNRQIDPQAIVDFARVPRTRAVDTAELNAAFQRVVATGFFRNVEFLPRGSTLVIRVEEYPLIDRVAIEGNRRIRDEQLRELIRSRPGGVFSPSQAEADANAMAERYAATGRLGARVTPRIIERGTGRVDLVFEVVEGRVVEVQRISFVGNRSFSEARLRNAIESAQAGTLSVLFTSDNFNEARIAADRQTLQDFYLSRGFVDAQVTAATTELTRERDGVFVTFTIREGRQYRFGRVSVVSELAGIEAAAYQAALTNRTGALFTPQALESLIQQAERVGARAGERFLRAEPRLTRNERDGIIDVELALVRGPREFIERIDIQGNTTTEDQVIRRQFQVAEGDPMNPREIREAAARIRELGFFSEVNVSPVAGSTPDQRVVDVQVEETTTGSLGFGLSFGANDGLGANITYSERNFLGRGQAIDLTVTTLRASRSFDLSFTEPALFGRDLEFGLRAGLTTTTAAGTAQFGSEVLQLAPSITFPISEFGRLNLRGLLARDQITVIPVPAAPALDPIAPRLRQDAAVGRVLTASLGFGFEYDTRDRGPDPDRGVVLRFGADLAGGDRRWARMTALAGYEQRFLNGDLTLRAVIEAGLVTHRSGPSRISERFALSSNQFRGFRPFGVGPVGFGADGSRHGLGGNAFAVLRLDAEFPLGLPAEYNMSGGLFLDMGTVRGIDARTPDVIDTGSIRAAIGASLVWRSPVGPLRFNFARPLRREPFDRPQNFDLTIATRF